MTISCDDFLDVAHILLSQNASDEKCIRSAINRAYYSAFIEARDKAIQLGLISASEKQGVHYKVRTALRPQDRTISSMLLGLSRKRNKADYNLNSNINLRDAQNAILLATTIKGRVKNV